MKIVTLIQVKNEHCAPKCMWLDPAEEECKISGVGLAMDNKKFLRSDLCLAAEKSIRNLAAKNYEKEKYA